MGSGHDLRRDSIGRRGPGNTRAAEPVPGKRTLTEQLPPRPADNALATVDQLIVLLATQPRADAPDGAYMLLSSLSIPELLAAMDGLANCGHLPRLRARMNGWTNPLTAARLLSALNATELVRMPSAAVATEQLKAAGMWLDLLPQDQQVQIVEYVLRRRGTGVNVSEVFEGALAMRESKDATRGKRAQGHAAGTTTGEPPPPVEPGPWEPLGRQPAELYIGNTAHKAIARHYEDAHPNEMVRANFTPMSSILRDLADAGRATDPGVMSKGELRLRPDITNLDRLHLYEIKPLDAQAVGAAKAAMYVSLFARAGITVALGPTTEPGVEGGIPAPAGVYVFWSPQPGVIVYQYRKGTLVPVPVGEPDPAGERRWKFELQPMTPQQRAAVTTITVGGMLLMIAMILLSPVGA